MATRTADATPAKRFFVEMLTRDIELQDSVLDLLDNCVDGVMRSVSSQKAKGQQPYKGYWAKIKFDKESFSLEDNCGGIPVKLAEQYAFRLGRPDAQRDEHLPTVGVYGIGMKRALFKMGFESSVTSQTDKEGFVVKIARQWLEDDKQWSLPLTIQKNPLGHAGTRITVTELRAGIDRSFGKDSDFTETLKKAIASYYGFIIEKGFAVDVNGQDIEPHRVAVLFDEEVLRGREGLAPYAYKAAVDGVDISLTIGMYRDIPSDDEEEEALQGKPSSTIAGWTVVCNDRVVLFADKSRVTGWGEATVPQYHTQFVSIAGIVEFRSNDAAKLPLTTTKRGIDGSSEIYLAVKDFMREGLKLFTDYTNTWKHAAKERRVLESKARLMSSRTVATALNPAKWSKVTKSIGGQKYRPNLPLPRAEDPLRQIRFSRREADIARVARYLFDDPSESPAKVGEKCFDDVLKKAPK